MAAVDGTDPLDSANVQHKLSPDTRGNGSANNGDLTLRNSALKFSNGFFKVGYEKDGYCPSGADGQVFVERITHGYVLDSVPSLYGVLRDSSQHGLSAGEPNAQVLPDGAWGPANQNFFAQRSVSVSWTTNSATSLNVLSGCFEYFVSCVVTLSVA